MPNLFGENFGQILKETVINQMKNLRSDARRSLYNWES
jgi:hypothetical protein